MCFFAFETIKGNYSVEHFSAILKLRLRCNYEFEQLLMRNYFYFLNNVVLSMTEGNGSDVLVSSVKEKESCLTTDLLVNWLFTTNRFLFFFYFIMYFFLCMRFLRDCGLGRSVLRFFFFFWFSRELDKIQIVFLHLAMTTRKITHRVLLILE